MAPRCRWSDDDDATLVSKLRWAKENGYQSDSGWKPQVWALCVEVLKDSPGPPKVADKVHDHWGNLKSTYVTVKTLHRQSGFGWDDGLKTVTASDDVWEAYLAKHRNAKRWRKTPFPLYDDLAYLVDGIVATGAGAFHAGASRQTQTQSTQSETQSQTQEMSRDTSPAPSEGPGSSFDQIVPSGDDDLTPSSPIRPPRKRAASSSPADTGRKTRKRNAEAASEMATALAQVAKSLNVVGSPENEEVTVMRLFTKDTAVAQTYIAASKKSMRTAFIRSVLDDGEL
ncbi:hypothetical protein B0H11DRAFT_2272238 [Mycena galericulata]|nr:hypothetical protein B0H11DRAFT_2272238 [Mycena galericulata]